MSSSRPDSVNVESVAVGVALYNDLALSEAAHTSLSAAPPPEQIKKKAALLILKHDLQQTVN